jgi:hypothetical protein
MRRRRLTKSRTLGETVTDLRIPVRLQVCRALDYKSSRREVPRDKRRLGSEGFGVKEAFEGSRQVDRDEQDTQSAELRCNLGKRSATPVLQDASRTLGEDVAKRQTGARPREEASGGCEETLRHGQEGGRPQPHEVLGKDTFS